MYPETKAYTTPSCLTIVHCVLPETGASSLLYLPPPRSLEPASITDQILTPPV